MVAERATRRENVDRSMMAVGGVVGVECGGVELIWLLVYLKALT